MGTVQIAGGGSGIGRAAALLFGERGADLMLVGRRPEPLEATAEEARARSGDVAWQAADVSVVDGGMTALS